MKSHPLTTAMLVAGLTLVSPHAAAQPNNRLLPIVPSAGVVVEF